MSVMAGIQHAYNKRAHTVRATKHRPSLRRLATSRALGLAQLNRRPARLIEWDCKRLCACRRRPFVLWFSSISLVRIATIESRGDAWEEEQTHARPLRSLISSSHASSSHHGITTTFLPSRVGTTSAQFVMALRRESNTSFARVYISCWITLSSVVTAAPIPSSGIGALTPLSRRTESACLFARSAGPISSLTGTPCKAL